MENIANAASMSVFFGQLDTLFELNYHIPCNPMVDSTEEKVLPSVNLPGQSMTVSHPIGVDKDSEDYVRHQHLSNIMDYSECF